MSKKIEYKCDLCHDIKVRKDLKCVYYGWVDHEKENAWSIVEHDDSDRHICKTCINMVKDYEEG